MPARRLRTVGVLVVAIAVGTALPAAADDLDGHLSREARAVFSGEQTLLCNTPDGTVSGLFEVSQADGVVISRSSDGTVHAAEVVGKTPPLGTAYDVVEMGRSRLLDRSVEVLELREGDRVRVALQFDADTGVVLGSDVFNRDGSVYCSMRFVSFEPGNAGLTALVDVDMADALPAVGPPGDRALPAAIAGFDRLRVSEGPEASVTAGFYGDGLFTFTLLNSPKVIAVPELADAPEVRLGAGAYRRQFELGKVFYSWTSDEGGYVLVGDLPMDLQEDVLEALPAPQDTGFLARLLRLFGR